MRSTIVLFVTITITIALRPSPPESMLRKYRYITINASSNTVNEGDSFSITCNSNKDDTIIIKRTKCPLTGKLECIDKLVDVKLITTDPKFTIRYHMDDVYYAHPTRGWRPKLSARRYIYVMTINSAASVDEGIYTCMNSATDCVDRLANHTYVRVAKMGD